MEIGYTMLERAILGLSGAAYCTGYSYAAWYFLKRNHRADEIPGMFRALTVLLLFLSSVLSLWQEHALLYAGTGMVLLIILSVGAYQRSRTGIVETLLFAMAVFGSYLIFTLLLQLLWFGFGSAVAMKVGEWYFLWRSAIYLILAAEYILISRYFVKVFRGKDQVLLTKGQTMIFLVFPFLMLGLLFGLYLGGDTLMLIYGYSSIAVIAFGIVLLHLLVTYLFGYMMEQQKKNLGLKLYEQQRQMMMHQYQELEEKYQASRKVIHDVKNHIQMIGELYHSGDLEAADAYCQDIGGMLRSLERVTYTDHRMLNLILNEKLNMQEMKGARLHIEIGTADLSFLKDIDVTTIFTNLLDNAREAIADTKDERYLFLKVEKAREFLVICLRNSCPAKPKTRKGHAGLGLVNVRHVVEAYGGTMQVSRIQEGYQTSITIPIVERREEV